MENQVTADIYFTSRIWPKKGPSGETVGRYVLIPEDVFDRGDYPNQASARQRLVASESDPRENDESAEERQDRLPERAEPLTLFFSPFDSPTHDDIFSVVIRMKSRSSAFVPMLRVFKRLKFNILHCSSIDMGNSPRGEPARLIIRIPATFLTLLTTQATAQNEALRIAARTGGNQEPQAKQGPLELSQACLKALEYVTRSKRSKDTGFTAIHAIVESTLTRISRAPRPESALNSHLSDLHARIDGDVKRMKAQALSLVHPDTAKVDPNDLFFLNLLSPPSSKSRSSKTDLQEGVPRDVRSGDQVSITVADLLQVLLFAALVLEPETLTAIQTPLHLRDSVHVRRPPEWICFSDHEAKPCPPPILDQEHPGSFRLDLPNDERIRHCPFATVTFYGESHLLRVSFKNREEQIITLRAHFQDQHGELIKVVEPLGQLNVDLRLIEPMRNRESSDRRILYEIVGNIRSSKLVLFDDATIERLATARMFLKGVATNETTKLHVADTTRDTECLRTTFSLNCIGPFHSTIDSAADGQPRAEPQIAVTSTLPLADQQHTTVFSRTYHKKFGEGFQTITCTLGRPAQSDIAQALLLKLMDRCWTHVSKKYSQKQSLMTHAMMDYYSTALYGVALLNRLTKGQSVLDRVSHRSGTMLQALDATFAQDKSLQCLCALEVPPIDYLEELYLTFVCDYIPYARAAGVWQWNHDTRSDLVWLDMDENNKDPNGLRAAKAFSARLDELHNTLASIRHLSRTESDHATELDEAVKGKLASAAEQIKAVCFAGSPLPRDEATVSNLISG